MIHQTIFDNFAKENAMELDRYRALVCAIETGSLSAAAEALQYTPSSVSRMVAALEEETAFRSCCASTAAFARQRSAKSCCPPSATYCTRARAAPSSPRSCAGLDVGTVTVGTAYSAFYSPLALHHIGFPRALRRHSGAAARWVQHRADHTAQRAPTRSVLHLRARGWARLAPHRLR